MAEEGVVIQIDLGVEGEQPATSSENEGIDLGQRGVALAERGVKALRDAGKSGPQARRQIEERGEIAHLVVAQAQERIDGAPGDLARVTTSHLFDVDPALARGHEDGAPGGPVDDQTQVELAGDFRGLFDQEPGDREAVDRQAEHRRCYLGGLAGRGRHADAASLATPPYQHLGLHSDGSTQAPRYLGGLLRPYRHRSSRNRDAISGQDRLRLEFVQLHRASLCTQACQTKRGPPGPRLQRPTITRSRHPPLGCDPAEGYCTASNSRMRWLPESDTRIRPSGPTAMPSGRFREVRSLPRLPHTASTRPCPLNWMTR